MQQSYPDPSRVIYPTTLPPRNACQLTSRDAGRMYPVHNHGAWLDANGDGNTDVEAGHFHRVRGFRVLPDESDGHTHGLSRLPCGAGAVVQQPVDMTPVHGFGDDGGTVVSAGLRPAVPQSAVPWIVGGLLVAGMLAGGIYLMCRDQGGG